MTSSDSLKLTFLHLDGLTVSGTFNPGTAPVASMLQPSFETARQKWLQKIASNPKSFNGHRAVLTGFDVVERRLELQTAYRTYADGRALNDALRDARTAGLDVASDKLERPCAELSWGFSLLTAVLLPGNQLLCNQRSHSLAVNPGKWTPYFTEIIEPSDIDGRDMQGLLDRLVAEETPALKGLGLHRYVGIGVRPLSYTWQLFSVLDLRDAAGVLQALEALAPDQETTAWGVLAISKNTQFLSTGLSLPTHFLTPDEINSDELDPVREFLLQESLDPSVAAEFPFDGNPAPKSA